ncbi:MAG: 2-C-methyl-D-erythritol 2,4-cyclodiphosphate synthase [Deltaproteobacteria bacterium]|nr:2-C-methyl-D-erythritol 2,4-cyclodiphosphate synthase [Deltaproteobacteria bacterium]
MRTGIGYDIHRLIPTIHNQSIPVGGVAVGCFYRVEAHSDGDVLLHALADACLGALALGDIGEWFPDNQPENKNRSSSEFLVSIIERIHSMGWEIYQCDAVLILEEPKIAPHRDPIREHIAKLFGIELSSVSVKAKTHEGLGDIGARKAIAAHAVVTVRERKG